MDLGAHALDRAPTSVALKRIRRMTVPFALAAFSLVVVGGLYLSRRCQHGYIDYLSPLLVIYAVHFVTRGATVFYVPEWLQLNPRVAIASEEAIAQAVSLAAVALCALIVCYLAALKLFRSRETPLHQVVPAALGAAVALLIVGLLCRLLLRLGVEELIALPDWAMTPVETFGWAALAGVYMGAFTCGRRAPGSQRTRAAWVTAVGTLAILIVDARMSVSREATLQPILAAVLGWTMGAGRPTRRIAVYVLAISLPLFVWIGAIKAYVNLDLGQGPGYLSAMPSVRAHSELTWPQWLVGATQDRFHGLDSLIVVRSFVPALVPYESDLFWSKVFISAFVPRALYPDKQVGWGARFATEFWGLAPETEGNAAVGISHLGTFFVYGGTSSCVLGMAVMGLGLGLLAAVLQRRRTVIGPTLFVLTALTICQVDRDLEVVLGGALKQVVIVSALMLLRPLSQASMPLRSARVARRPHVGTLAGMPSRSL